MFVTDLIVAPLLSSPSSLLSQTLDPFTAGSGGVTAIVMDPFAN